MLLPLVHSRQHPYINLRNQITIWNQFSHLQYKKSICQQIFENESEETAIFPESRVFSTENAAEELYSPSRKYNMNKAEIKRLRIYYSTALDKHSNKIGVGFFYVVTWKTFELLTHLILS
jgi:hypothetical protein